MTESMNTNSLPTAVAHANISGTGVTDQEDVCRDISQDH